MRPRSFFLAGVMQGSRQGAELADQGYRARLGGLIRHRHPDAVVNDPGELMDGWLGDRTDAIRASHGALAGRAVVRREDLDDGLTELVAVFHRLTDLAAASDVCVAWLPGHQASMGTAAEMYSAHRAGRTVVAITPMRQNLAVLACSSVVLPDEDAFARWLAGDDGRV
ncbi:hypothetical protein ACFOVU_08645 [Nocardiopsis sediminis]|uniref:Nucleoside 2-deoxyribosyltransferase n=1 Tax=Nocardiopsis sediminis TaxID=1778267 RepID=A0ABV8FIP4_9ACTN